MMVLSIGMFGVDVNVLSRPDPIEVFLISIKLYISNINLLLIKHPSPLI